MNNAVVNDLGSTDVAELDSLEIDYVSGGHPVAVAAAALVALGSASLDFGRNLGATTYRILH